jgi:hypothetical protein
MIEKIDVEHVAHSLNKKLTEKQINEVLEMYPAEQDNDPTASWDLVIENCIYQILDIY